MLAVIINNEPWCPICEMLLGNMTGEYRQVVDSEGNTYTEFERYCNGTCHGKYKYQSNITLDSTTRYAIKNTKPIKDSGEKNVDDSSN